MGDLFVPIYDKDGKFRLTKMKTDALKELEELFKQGKITFSTAPSGADQLDSDDSSEE